MSHTGSPDRIPANARPFFIAALKCGVAAAAMLAVSPTVAAAQEVENVVVTGTSIRGVAPVGANVISVGRSDIDAIGATSMNQLIQNVPQISSFGNDGAFFSSNAHTGTGQDAPAIHNLGASSSQSTLILIDGHNFTPTDGYTDPGVIPTIAIQRVDILADGDSAIYGSSAVAGVINYVTRTDYEGFQTQFQYSAAQDYASVTASQLWGHRWDNGSAMFAVEYRSASRLSAGNRDFSASQDLRRFGGTNFMNYECNPATIAANNAGASSVYAFPYNGAPVAAANNTNAGICDVAAGNSIIPSRTSTSVLFKINQTLSDRLNIGLDMNYASRVQQSVQAQGNIDDTVYGPTGSSPGEGTAARNPFYVAGPLSTTSQFIRYNPTALIGPSFTKSGMRAFSGNFRASYDFGADWIADLNAFAGYNQGYIHSSNRLCTACAHLALNGSTNTTGAANNSIANSAQTDTFLLGTVYNVTRALNVNNALDVWNPAGPTNRTSATVIRELQSDYTDYDENSDLNDVRLKFNGPLFDLWGAGPIKLAFGAEYQLIHDHPRTVNSNGIGPSNADSKIIYAPLQRKVQSAFAEFYVPLVSPEMGVPLVQKFDVNIAGRWDKYNDVGITENPRLGFTWTVSDAVKLRGNYGTSFTAPNMQYLSSVVTGSVTTNTTVFTVPSDHPAIGPGRICSNPAVPCVFDSTLPGILTSVGNPDLKPMKGQTYSAGIDFDGGSLFPWMKGFIASVTYWQVKFIGGLTAVTLDNNLTLKGLQNLLQLAPPGGWTLNSPEVQAAIGNSAVTSALPAQIYYIGVNGRRNAFNVWANGIDFDAHYAYTTEGWGDFVFGVSGSEKLRFDLQGGPIGSTAPIQDYLNGRNETSTLKATQFNGRADVRWSMDPWDVNFAMNYTNPYWYRTTTAPFNTATEVPPGFPPGGFQRIHANVTFDLNVAYNLPTNWAWGLTEGTQLTFNVHNLFDTDPPFHNSGFGNFNTYTTGYDQYNASPIGRLITVGLSKKW
jgi:iron complex outermembrane receptor protein